MVWECEVCGYLHEGPEPPEVCPVCGVGPELFSAVSDAPAEPVDEPPASAEPTSSVQWECTVCGYLHTGAEPPDPCPICGVEPDLFERVGGAEVPIASTEALRLVVVGAGAAGIAAAERARRLAPAADIAVVSKERGLPYHRLSLTLFMAGEVDEASLPLKPSAWYAEQRITLVEGEVVAVERLARQVRLRDGRTLPYDRLILANGSHPFVPPFLGVRREGVVVVRTLSQARDLLRRALPGVRCVCIGGGLLGLETAGALARRGAAVTLLEGSDRLLPRQLPQAASELLEAHVESLGIEVRLSVQVSALVGDEAVCAVSLADGEELPAEVVVLSTGVRSNVQLARRAGLRVELGVVVDERMATSDESVYAAGDVAEHEGVVRGLWTTARVQGEVAGANAVGGDACYEGLPPAMWLKVLDLAVFSIGDLSAESAVEERGPGRYLRIACRDGRIVGACLVGDDALAGPLQQALSGRTPVVELTGPLGELLTSR